jgi:hypothetical protein
MTPRAFRAIPPAQNPSPQPAGSAATVATTLTVASALSIGSNLVEVRRGRMTLPGAVLNGLVKGAAASLILAGTRRTTAPQVVLAAVVLGGAGFLIDSAMKTAEDRIAVRPSAHPYRAA